jgi:hypothetical protein
MAGPEQAEIQKLYGVRHGGQEMHSWGMVDIFIAPSRGLTKDLLMLPQGTSVGIEWTPELEEPIEVGKDFVDISQSNIFYWQRIQRIARMNSLDIQYLDSADLFRKHFEKAHKSKAMYEKVGRTADLNRHMQYLRTAYQLGVESDYTFEVEREEAMLAKITALKPAVVIVGQAHGDVFANRLDELRTNGIIVGTYLAEDSSEKSSKSILRPRERAVLNLDPTPDNGIIVDRALIERKYRAITEGRVLATDAPDFIGTWDPMIPARGLFEVFVESNGRAAIIDTLGNASASGTFSAGHVDFRKLYDWDFSAQDAVIDFVNYSADMKPDGRFFGLWNVEEMGGGSFTMVPYAPGIDVNKTLGLTF